MTLLLLRSRSGRLEHRRPAPKPSRLAAVLLAVMVCAAAVLMSRQRRAPQATCGRPHASGSRRRLTRRSVFIDWLSAALLLYVLFGAIAAGGRRGRKKFAGRRRSGQPVAAAARHPGAVFPAYWRPAFSELAVNSVFVFWFLVRRHDGSLNQAGITALRIRHTLRVPLAICCSRRSFTHNSYALGVDSFPRLSRSAGAASRHADCGLPRPASGRAVPRETTGRPLVPFSRIGRSGDG
jgi:hypothetical protein